MGSLASNNQREMMELSLSLIKSCYAYIQLNVPERQIFVMNCQRL